MRLVDIQAISEIAHTRDCKVVVDNTYATPYLQRPIELGADFVVHSATKYLGGHGDLVAGMVVGGADDISEVRLFGLKDMTGAVMAPSNAMLIMRGLKTLELRMDRHVSTAMSVARMLEDHHAVRKVYYPGLESFEQHELAKRQMSGFGGMIAFELDGGLEEGMKMMNALELVQRAVSLGDAETLIQHPASMTHSTYTPEERHAHCISDGLIIFAFYLHWDCQPLYSLRGFDLVTVTPITPSVLHIIVENEFINSGNHIKITFPRNIIRLGYGNFFIHLNILFSY